MSVLGRGCGNGGDPPGSAFLCHRRTRLAVFTERFVVRKGLLRAEGRTALTNVDLCGIFPLLPKVFTATQGVVASGVDLLICNGL